GRSLDAAIPALIVGVPVAVFFEIGLIVLLVVGHRVAQREAVVRGDEVDAGRRLAAIAPEQVAGTGEAFGESAQHAPAAVPESPHGVAVTVVPFRPAGRKVAELVAAETDVPGLGDEL